MAKTYIATKGAPFKKVLAQKYGKELERISNLNNGQLDAKNVVETAKDKSSPLHDYFEWDTSKAAENFRVYQARLLINHITVIVKYNGSQRETKAFFSVNSTPDGEKMNKTYVTINRVLGEPELRSQVIKTALSEAEYWKSKYTQYVELGKIFNAIEQTKKKVKVIPLITVNKIKKVKNKKKKIAQVVSYH